MKPDIAMDLMLITLVLGAGVFAFAATAGSSLKNEDRLETATFAGGCFWCIEADFESVPGVKKSDLRIHRWP